MRKGKPAQLRIRLRRKRWLIPAQGWHNPGLQGSYNQGATLKELRSVSSIRCL